MKGLSLFCLSSRHARRGRIKPDERQPSLQALPKPQRTALLEPLSNERKELSAKLVAERDAYIAARRIGQRPKGRSSDQAVAATLKAQITRA